MSHENELLQAARESNRWLRILALPMLRDKLEGQLKKPESKRIYQQSDGRTIRDVATAAGVGPSTVHRYWQEWVSQGLVEPTETAGRFRRIIDLKEVGLEE